MTEATAPSATQPTEEQEQAPTEDIVTAFDIQAATDAGINYDKLIESYGCFKLFDEHVQKIEKLTGKKAHPFLRRNIFFCHRDLDYILKTYEAEKPFYLYTGRGPSAEALHLGHAIPFIFCQWMQEAFDVPIVIQITDDEKYIYRPELELEGPKGTIAMGISNIKDIIAFGFDPEKTFIFSDVEYIQHLYPNVIRVQKHVNFNQIKGIFGFTPSDCVGKFAFPPVQCTPAFSNSFPHIYGKRTNIPCLIPCAIDQDPYFRMTRDISHKLKYEKPASIYSTFFPALQGKKSKMSSSDVTSSILLTDTAAQIKSKVNKYAKSGGGATVEEHRANGADLDVDVPFQYLQFFLDDDEKLEDVRVKYSNGEMLTGEVKTLLIDCLQTFVAKFQEKRKKVTNETVKQFMAIRKINPFPKHWAAGKKFTEENAGTQAKQAQPQPSKQEETKEAAVCTLITDSMSNHMTTAALIAADLSKAPVIVQVSQDKADYPLMVTGNGTKVNQAFAIGSFFANESSASHNLMGKTPFQHSQVEQFAAFAASSIVPASAIIEGATFGSRKVPVDQLKAARDIIENAVRQIDHSLEGNKKFLVGDKITLADILMFCALTSAYQLILDSEFRKTTTNASRWFTHIASLPQIKKRAGAVRVCQVSVPPQL